MIDDTTEAEVTAIAAEPAKPRKRVRKKLQAKKKAKKKAAAPRKPKLRTAENTFKKLKHGQRSDPPPPDVLAINRERGKVAAFLRLGGRDWMGPGPSPLEPGCQISKRVLKEFAERLDDLRYQIAQLSEMGLPPGTVVTR